jgi:DNA-binding CsgD family transcriptional regulator
MRDSTIILPEKHISLTSSSDVDEILKPLKKLGILYFTYMRNYPDCSQVYLSNDSSWVEAYYGHRLYETSQFQLAPESYRSGKIVWPVQSDLPVYQYAREYLKSDNGLTIIKKHDNYTEFYFFSSSVDNHGIHNVYINNMVILEKFVLYFNDRADKIIGKAEENKLFLPPHVYQQSINNMGISIHPADIINNVLDEMQIKKYRIKHNGYYNIKLSSRELECIFLYHKGKTAKETARALNISQRTVETYFENIKNKLNCYSKDQVVNFLIEDGFF